MTVWWLTLISTYFLALIAVKSGRVYTNKGVTRYRPNVFFAFQVCTILILLSGLRSNVGDTKSYMYSFENGIPYSVQDFLRTTKYEGDWGFNLFQTFIKQYIGDDSQYMIFVCALITIFFIFITFYKYSDSLELAIFYFIAAGNYLVTMNGIRQYLVSSILFAAFPWVVKRKWYYYFPLVIMISTMHKSALLFIPIYFIANGKAWGKVTKWILVVGVLLFLTYNISGPIIAELLGETQYGGYKEMLVSKGGGANFIRVLVYAVPVILSYRGRKSEKLTNRPEYNVVVNMSILNLIFILLANKYWIYARFNMYFSLYAILLLVWCVKYLSRKNRQLLYLGSIFMYGLYYWYEMHISLGQVYMSNYIRW